LLKSIVGITIASSPAESIVAVVAVSKIGIGICWPTRYNTVSNNVAVTRKGGGRSSTSIDIPTSIDIDIPSTTLLSLERSRPLGRRLLREGLLEALRFRPFLNSLPHTINAAGVCIGEVVAASERLRLRFLIVVLVIILRLILIILILRLILSPILLLKGLLHPAGVAAIASKGLE